MHYTWVVLALCAAVAQGREIDRIYGGSNAALGRYPYMASLQIRNFHVCGASIIRTNYVLSAAHCLPRDQSALNYQVVVGTIDTRSGTRYNINRVAFHGSYNSSNQVNDILLIRTSTNIIFNANVQPIAIQAAFEGSNRNVRLTGWGYYTRSQNVTATFLQQIDLVTMTNDQCRQANYQWPITDGHICTSTRRDYGFCRGDSGGPLVDIQTGQQVGIVSFNTVDCAIGYPDVYTRTGYYLNWINTNAV